MFEGNHWQEWAREWGLTHIPQKGKLYRDEGVVGVRNGFLVRANWGGDKGTALIVLVRFPRGQDLARVRDALTADPALEALPGKGAARAKMAIEEPGRRVVRIGSAREFVLRDGTFLTAFRNKGRLADLMARIPVHVIVSPDVGLLGAACAAAE